MNADSIFLLATKCTVIAFHRETGHRLWKTALKTGWTSTDFVSLVADERRVFAYTKGEIFCLDLFTGAQLWSDGLSGFGYNIASLALPGSTQARMAEGAQILRQIDRQRSSSND